MPQTDCNERILLYNLLVNLPVFRNGISDGQYCAYDPHAKKDSCQGDAGGPLQLIPNDSTVAHVVGIVSFSFDCGSSIPGIYTRVAHYLDWIEPIVWPGTMK